MGAEHLRAWGNACAAVAAFGSAMLACRSVAPPPSGDGSRVTLAAPAAGARGAHVQIVRAMPTASLVALVERFRARNGAEWAITLGAGGAPDDVDAIRGVVRRAKREAGVGVGADAGAEADGGSASVEAGVEASAIAFVALNADFFGISPADVPALDVEVGPAKTAMYGAWVVHLRGRMPMRGYDGFETVASSIDVLVYLGEDGSPRYFVNLSRVHPRLVLDTAALIGPDDQRLLRFVLGREMFVVIDDPRRPNARVRELRRMSVGRIEQADVRAVRLTIHVSPGPRGAYVSYWLAYAVDVRREHQDFRFVVDADTGNLLDDAVVPVVSASGLSGD